MAQAPSNSVQTAAVSRILIRVPLHENQDQAPQVTSGSPRQHVESLPAADGNFSAIVRQAPQVHATAVPVQSAPLVSAFRTNDQEQPDAHGMALIRAVLAELDQPAIHGLLQAGAEVNQLARCDQFNTLLHHMLVHRRRAWLQPVDNGDRRVSALMVAACKGNLSNMALLIAAGAKLELQGGPKGYTALMMAIVAREPAAVKTLLEHKADVGAMGSDGSTALYLACCKGDCDTITMLINAGAEVDQEDEQGMTALTSIMKEFHSNTGTLLQAKFADVTKVLMAAGADPKHKDKKGATWFAKRSDWSE